MSTVISMLIGSKLSTKDLVTKSVCSIIKNFGNNDFLLVIGIASHVTLDIVIWIDAVQHKNSNVVVITDTDYCSSYARFQNHVFLKYGPGSKWFILSHDDIELQTPNLIGHVEASVGPLLDKVGWISFTDTDYLNGHWAPSIGGGYHDDFLYENAWLTRKLHQFHLLQENYWEKHHEGEVEKHKYFSSLAYDFPTQVVGSIPYSVVKCHGPLSHFFMIETEKLKKIGLCEDWSEVSLLIDEDWALEALKEDLFNVWIPRIKYQHCRVQDGTRAWPLLVSRGQQVRDSWAKKWGYQFTDRSKETANRIKKMYGHTNITWSMDKQSFDWEYLQ